MNRVLEFRDLPGVINAIASSHDLHDGDALIALVRNPETTQEICCVERLPISAYLDYWEDARDVIHDTVHGMPIPDRDPDGMIVCRLLTIVVRRGYALISRNEVNWLSAWRYSNHNCAALDGHLVTVTEHGWHEWYSDDAGHTPALLTG